MIIINHHWYIIEAHTYIMLYTHKHTHTHTRAPMRARAHTHTHTINVPFLMEQVCLIDCRDDFLFILLLNTLAVDNGRTRFIVLLLRYPHLLEGGDGTKDWTSNPCREFPLGRSNNLDTHRWWTKNCHLFLYPVSNAWEHCATSRQQNVSIQISCDVCRTTHDGVVTDLVDTSRLHAQEGWLEKSLGASELLVANGDHLTIRKFIALLQTGAGGAVCISCSKSRAM